MVTRFFYVFACAHDGDKAPLAAENARTILTYVTCYIGQAQCTHDRPFNE